MPGIQDERPLSVYGRENPYYRAGVIGDFPVMTPRDWQGERELFAAPATAARLRSAFDLDVQTTEAVDEGTVYVFDMAAIERTLRNASTINPRLTRAVWEPQVTDPKDIVKIVGPC